ncbi:GNAT family N-acetyltransferase [Pseudoxanthomonas dokdonensis]|uniref:GCN5 family acetyltransferase n=1 Tax=Pseudoxanthomonas dokdonensis TaxID=344882 RepID=A0A0R0CFB8_9GAMM|nr:GNAT family N-acetyltransferase [Pseudoxanthomonas dokdonensis]KRG68000.1 GCN5 family acetyltransferase [Pseudoxanthomonas dokdonensis]
MNDLTFRTATLDDIPALIELVTSSYRGDASRQGWTTEADLLDGQRIDADGLAHDIQRPDSLILLGCAGDGQDPAGAQQILACAHLAIEDGAGYFGMFSVRPGQQGNGIGKQMMIEAERIVARQWQLPSVRMTVIDVRDELIAFYQRRGYVRTGIKKPFPYGDERYGIPRRDDLRFEVLEKDLRHAFAEQPA